jgi:hypothetical protein
MIAHIALHFESLEELQEFLTRNKDIPAVTRATETAKPPKAQATPAKTPAPAKAEKPAAAPVEEADDAEEDGAEETSAAPTFDDVKQALLKVNKLKGRAATVAVLEKFKIEKLTREFDEKNFAAFIAACNKALD